MTAFRDSVAGMNVSFICIGDCVTCLSQLLDPAKVSDPAEDCILSLHQHFSIHPTACLSKLHMKEIFAKTTLAASVTNTLFELFSVCYQGLTEPTSRSTCWRWSSVQHPSQSHPVTLSTYMTVVALVVAARPVPSSLPQFSER